ncbi:MAG: phosphoglycerate dehydrogenase [Nitrospinota bacterium]
MSDRVRVLVAESLSPVALEELAGVEGFEAEERFGLSREALRQAIPPYDALVIRSGTRVDAPLLEAGESLRVVARAGIGVDNVDVEAATERGVLVMNAPEGNVVTTAEHTLALLLALARKVPQAMASLRSGAWERGRFVGAELFEKTLGVVGLGRVGSAVVPRAQGLGMKVIVHDPYISAEAAARRGVRLVDLSTLLRESDYITLHVPLTPETRHLIGRDALAQVKRGARLINCSRGGVADEEALIEALEAGRLAGAGLDVFEEEPPRNRRLLEREDVVVTPHLGASTREAQENVALAVVRQLVAYFRDGAIINGVNMPALGPELLEKVGPYLKLAEKLGSFLAQLSPGGIRGVRVRYAGPLEEPGIKPLTAAALKGVLSHFLHGARVNLVNAAHLAKEREIEVAETTSGPDPVFADLLEVELRTDAEARRVAGTFVRPGMPRIVRLDDYHLEADPTGYMLVFTNRDAPGVIGRIGTILGNNQINIAGMQLGRVARYEMAVALVNVDDPIPPAVLAEIRALGNIMDARLVQL